MDSITNIVSFFCVEKTKLDKKEAYKLLLYCGSTKDSENWDLSVENGWINACCIGEDTGKFYEYLQSVGLDKKVEIIRG